MQKSDLRQELITMARDAFPHDDCSEFDEATIADVVSFVALLLAWARANLDA